MKYDVPFYSNTPDDTHCYQAAFRMVLKYFWPDRDFSWQELEVISAKGEGLWTWPMAGLIWFQKSGFEVKNIEVFDYQRFIDEGESYLIEEYGPEVAQATVKHSNIKQEQNIAREFILAIKTERRIPNISDIILLLKEKFLVICNINSLMLNNEKGYAGHSIVVAGFFNNNLILHDPGLPPKKNRKVSFSKFDEAWAYPGERAKNIMAFRPL